MFMDRYMRRRFVRAWRVSKAIIFGDYLHSGWDGEHNFVDYQYRGEIWRVPDASDHQRALRANL